MAAFLMFVVVVVICTIGECRTQQAAAHPNATVRFGRARFSVLGGRLIRMEMGLPIVQNGTKNYTFDDRATSVVINRVRICKLIVYEYAGSL